MGQALIIGLIVYRARGSIWELSVLTVKFLFKSKTAPQNKLYHLKKYNIPVWENIFWILSLYITTHTYYTLLQNIFAMCYYSLIFAFFNKWESEKTH